MSRVIKVKDKKINKSSKPAIEVGDLVTSRSEGNKCIFLVTGYASPYVAYALFIRYSYGKAVDPIRQERITISEYKHYRGKLTIKQD